MGMIIGTRPETVADDFIENNLKEVPEMIYHLYESLEEYIQEQQLNLSKDEILEEHSKIKCEDIVIINRDLNILNRFCGKASEIDESNLLFYFRSIPDSFLKELTTLVMISDKVRMRRTGELEIVEQDDLIMPNKWIYHKHSDYNKVLEYIRDDYDMLRREDEIEDVCQTNMQNRKL